MAKSNWSSASRQSRGYGADWDRLRLQVLRRDHGLCQCDQCKGGALRVTVATEVHHIKAKADGGTDRMDNLQAINTDCHMRLTIIDRGDRPARRIGIDGFPTD